MNQVQTFNEVAAFISYEADLLDHKDYRAWLELWQESGHYIVPIDVHSDNFEDNLNFAYDDAAMRKLRVDRLLGGESVSSQAMDRTVRSVSRFRVLADEGDTVHARCAMMLGEVRHEQTIHYAADLDYVLRRDGEGSFRIERKVVRLLNAEAHLRTVAFIF